MAIGVCRKCGKMFESTEEDTNGPDVSCPKCYLSNAKESVMTEREMDRFVGQFKALPAEQRGKLLDYLIAADDSQSKAEAIAGKDSVPNNVEVED